MKDQFLLCNKRINIHGKPTICMGFHWYYSYNFIIIEIIGIIKIQDVKI
jgi:hypothetical protein